MLLLSSRSRVFDRDAEAPDRVVRPFRARMLAQPAPTPADLAQLEANLTDGQRRGLTDRWGWRLEGANIPPPWVRGGLHEARHHFRLWASLTPIQRREASGGQLGVDAMSAAQKRLCGLDISAPGCDLDRPKSIRIPTPESPPRLTASFGLRPRLVESQTYRDDEGRETADITTVGKGGVNELNRPRFGARPRVSVGPSTRMQAYDFIYYVSDGNVGPQVARSVDLHPVPRWWSNGVTECWIPMRQSAIQCKTTCFAIVISRTCNSPHFRSVLRLQLSACGLADAQAWKYTIRSGVSHQSKTPVVPHLSLRTTRL